MFDIQNTLPQIWSDVKQRLFPSKQNATTPLDQVSRFYQSDFYRSLDENIKSTFYDGPLGGLDSRIHPRSDKTFLHDCIRLWQNGRNVSCAIYGEKGTGLSTLLNVLGEEIKKQAIDHKLISLNQRLTSEADVIETLCRALAIDSFDFKLDTFIQKMHKKPPCVILIDNLHFLVQRTLNAQTVIDALSSIVLATRGHHLWIIASEEQAWRRLCYGYQFEHLFSHTHYIENYSDSEIRNLLVKRFSYAGIHHVNDIPIEKLQDEKSPVSDIAKRSKGCIELAIFYCLNNLTYGLTPKSLYITSPLEIDTTPLKTLSQMERFTLSEICAHGVISAREHQTIFRISLNESKMTLERLRVLGILEKDESANHADTYCLKLIISSVVIRYLISMNYLY